MKTIRELINLIESAQAPLAEDQATRTCPTCDGSGEDALDPTKSCRRCGGKGHVPVPKEPGVTEDLIDHDAAEPLARHFAELYYNGLSSADEAKMAARVYQQVVDGEMSIEQLKQHIAKLEKEKGVAEATDEDVEHLANAFADIYYGGAGMGMISATEKVKLARNIVQAVDNGRLSVEQLKQDLKDVGELQQKLGRDGRFDKPGVAENTGRAERARIRADKKKQQDK